ncbi:hypothetical protein [Salimicrobium flavidum]|uniref:Uncharacterized protein n=1 Tax=Salimicrobium flavidum TaxID=570947 RepID=A0A1N7J1B8_9BACI|nr:hypothetical protein [Salimicrobium flavidum]SIS43056.1 hypothetical protein SAMN05421687_103158 [Salimicrobium flavidum]
MCIECERLESRVRQQEETVAQLIGMMAVINNEVKNLIDQKESVPERR